MIIELANVAKADETATALDGKVDKVTGSRLITSDESTLLGNTSGTNSGDETTSTIKTKLGITTLSGSNTGDQDLSGLVPYTGATSDVNLGEFGVQLGKLEFDNTPTNAPTTAGSMVWNDSDGTLDLKLKGGNVTLQIGQESVLRVVNKTATNITLLEANYQAVRVTGAQGQRLKVDLAQATTDALSAETIGIVTETINNNQEGFVTTNGLVRGINTTGSLQSESWADGDVLYLSPTTAGRLTKVKPTAPNHLVIIGYVVYAHATQGSIFVKVDNGYELDELHNVKITSATNNDLLTYNSSTGVWENKSISIILGYTPVTNARTISTTGPLSGGGDLSANRTLSISQANISTDGYLSSTDWNTFNNKRNNTAATTGVIAAFATSQIYNTVASPATGNITDNLTGANIGIVQKIYHNDSVAPTFPAGWVKLGSGTYTTSSLNIIYAEWISGTRVEYWIVKGS